MFWGKSDNFQKIPTESQEFLWSLKSPQIYITSEFWHQTEILFDLFGTPGNFSNRFLWHLSSEFEDLFLLGCPRMSTPPSPRSSFCWCSTSGWVVASSSSPPSSAPSSSSASAARRNTSPANPRTCSLGKVPLKNSGLQWSTSPCFLWLPSFELALASSRSDAPHYIDLPFF